MLLDSGVQRGEGTRRGRLLVGMLMVGPGKQEQAVPGPFSFRARNGIPHGQVSPFCCWQQVRLMSLGLATVDAGFVQKIAICC